MSRFPLPEDRRTPLDGLVAPAVMSDPQCVDDAWARAVWSVLVEPGDGVAGALIGMLGALDALEVVSGAVPAPIDLEELGSQTEDPIAAALQRWRPRLVPSTVTAALAAARRSGLRLVTPQSPHWPHALDDLGPHAPVCLWVRGDPAVVGALGGGGAGGGGAGSAGGGGRAAAIVGARAATGYGEHVAMELAGGLGAAGVTIVSGAAYGIDGAAHRAALTTGSRTIAVLAGGVDRSYPAGHTDLLDRISATGAVVSEVAPGGAPTKWRFLQRNRLIAALGDATIVVEAGWRSGSLNTAAHAAALGRPLGAVPGPVTSAASTGCHRLLREFGAQCVTGVPDAQELLGAADPAAGDGSSGDARSAEQVRVLDALSTRAPRSSDDVARRAGIAPHEVDAVLGLLELEGIVARDRGSWRRATAAPTLF